MLDGDRGGASSAWFAGIAEHDFSARSAVGVVRRGRDGAADNPSTKRFPRNEDRRSGLRCNDCTDAARADASAQPAPPRYVFSSEVTGQVPIRIPLVNPHYPVDAAGEANALASDVNAERAKRGIPPLQRDDTLDRFAYAKAVEMAARGYFGHTDPNGVTFQDRLRAAGWTNRYAAENMAFDQDEKSAHQAFLRSPGHYGNIIDGHSRRLGVAVVAAGDGEIFYVEEFAD